MLAKIVVRDEVNCSLKDLSLDMRKQLVRQFKYEIPHARFMPAYKLGRWDGTVSFFNLGGSTYVNLLPEILETLVNNGWDFELEDQREYQTNFELEQVSENSFKHIKWPEGHPVAGQSVELRDYQIQVINDYLKNPQCLQEVATGAGKCVAYDTKIKIKIDENSDFGMFLLNKFSKTATGSGNDVTRIFNIVGSF